MRARDPKIDTAQITELLPHQPSEKYDLEGLKPAEISDFQVIQAAVPFDLFEATSHDALLRKPTWIYGSRNHQLEHDKH
jgi:hypothetical protein